MREVDVVALRETDQISDRPNRVERRARFGHHGDIEVASVRFAARGAAEHGENPDPVPITEGVKLSRLRCVAEPGKTFRGCPHTTMAPRGCRPRLSPHRNDVDRSA
jgi:hypothetical protein